MRRLLLDAIVVRTTSYIDCVSPAHDALRVDRRVALYPPSVTTATTTTTCATNVVIIFSLLSAHCIDATVQYELRGVCYVHDHECVDVGEQSGRHCALCLAMSPSVTHDIGTVHDDDAMSSAFNQVLSFHRCSGVKDG